MLVQVDTRELKSALAVCNRIAKKRSTLPILSSVRIIANGNIALQNTDLEVAINARVDGSISEKGEACIVADSFCQTVRSIKLDTNPFITISADDVCAKVEHSSAVNTLSTFPTDDYPDVSFHLKSGWKVNRSELIDTLKTLQVCAAQDDVRYLVNSVYFKRDGDWLEVAATDASVILGIRRIKIRGKGRTKMVDSFILPLSAVKQCNALKGETINIVVKERNNFTPAVTLSDGKVDITSRTVEGEYPNYHKIVVGRGDDEYPYSISLPLQKIKDFVKANQYLTKKPFTYNHISILIDDKVKLEAVGRLYSYGKNKDDESVEKVILESGGHYLMAGFNFKQFSEYIATIDGKNLVMYYNDVDKRSGISMIPSLFVSDSNIQTYIMPTRINEI